MPHIFISYAKKDTYSLAVQIRDALKVIPGVTTWMDEFLEEGESWAVQIQNEIRQCDLMVVLLSPDVNRVADKKRGISFVINEIDYARRLNKHIIPVMAQLTDPPVQIASLQYIDLTLNSTAGVRVLLKRVAARLNIALPPSWETALSEVSEIESEQSESDGSSSSHHENDRQGIRISRFMLGGVILVIALVVLALIITNLLPPSVTLTPTTAIALAGSLTATPTLSETELELTIRAEMLNIATEAAETSIAQATATQAYATAFAQTTLYADSTENANKTATATLWTATPTPNARLTAEARLTETQQVVNLQATQVAFDLTATATLWTATPTPLPGYPSGAKIIANYQWKEVKRIFDGVEMVLVPSGCFRMGSTDGEKDEQPPNGQCFDQPFWIDRTEVTNAQFELFNGVAGTGSISKDPYHPRENITWFEARDYCVLRGGRLPTEAEWEYSARGPDGLIYPWGDRYDFNKVIYNRSVSQSTAEVGSRLDGASWVGALDMSGNVWEWVSSIHWDYPYRQDDGREDMDNRIYDRSLRGSSWAFDSGSPRSTNRNGSHPGIRYTDGGFRCARDYER